MSNENISENLDRIEEITTLATGPASNQLQPDQAAVFLEFHENSGRVVVDAGAGTGKTTVLIRTVAEAVVREVDNEGSPFERILLTTFSNDAANELKTRLKAQLREHDAHSQDPLPRSVWREIETAADIGTIDSFFHDLIGEIAIDIGLPPDFEVRGQLETETLLDEIFAHLQNEHPGELRRLQTAYSPEEWREYPPKSVREIVYRIQQKCREFCWSVDSAVDSLWMSFEDMHAGEDRPTDLATIDRILEMQIGEGETVDPLDGDMEQQLIDHVRDTYDRSSAIIEDFETVLRTFNEQYDELTRSSGLLSHTDVTYLLWEALTEDPDGVLAQSLSERYDYVFIDEFQDTSHAQCEVLSHLITEEKDGTQLMLIGDVKQSIYEWRSAEPNIFNDIIDHARDDSISDCDPAPHVEAAGITYLPLVSNFRSHPHIISTGNRVFADIFADDGRGRIGSIDIDYVPLEARRPNTEPDDPHVHILDMGGETKRDFWVTGEAQQAAETILSIIHGETAGIAVDRSPLNSEQTLEDPEPGDITFLFRARRHMHIYAEELRNRGLEVSVDASDDLFEQPEVRLMIDILDWFANPHSRPSLVRILRSPLVALSDETLRALASEQYYLRALLDDWPDTLPIEDQHRLEGLATLRNDLRWGRETAKSDLVYKILRHSGFETVVLADTDALERYGNLWLLGEIVDQWEEDELLPYREFVERLTTIRDRSVMEDPDYTTTRLADEQNRETITLTTVHASKGREFSIVFLVDLLARSNWPRTQLDRLLTSRTHGMALRPRQGETPFPPRLNIPSPDDDNVWLSEDYDAQPPSCTGPIWLSDARVERTGQFEYPNPLNAHLKEREAEFWRMLYVGFTRVRDHLFLGLGHSEVYKGEWNTWMAPLRDQLLLGSDEIGNEEIRLLDTPQNDVRGVTEAPDSVPIGIDDIPLEAVEPERTVEIDVDDAAVFLENSGPDESVEEVPFLPETVDASGVHHLLECPRRFQYSVVQGQSSIRYETEAVAAPGELPPKVWGDIVHKALALWHQNELEFRRYLSDLDETVADTLRTSVLKNYRRTSTRQSINSHADEVVIEHPVRALLEVDGHRIPFYGKIDLLYRDGSDWMIVDFKTGEIPDTGSYHHEQYRRQLTAYAWLVQEVYDITIQDAKVVYVHPEYDEDAFSPDIEAFERSVADSINSLKIDKVGLEARPDPKPSEIDDSPPSGTRCGSCPYAASVGGPCKYG
ncbi:UvrD-helicase domain-containing protein [Natronorarus salvus]|uniref:UvrD-helicase domain-containing protein n=1 Tax=Natronorarus salvus TaxID=3117733 RepID=UPI002F26B07E